MKNPDRVHPLPEVCLEDVEVILLACRKREDKESQIYGSMKPLCAEDGKELDGFLIAIVMQTIGISEEGTVQDLLDGAETFLQIFNSSAVA